ncbi:TIGR02530 family flagellar biosynthesis protein [Paenibacillus alkalitolerans]|uniref:TIGR02530 family flagellar biosynthesis protein n=1 Tax=Paenibacillus alkalitolerans TaxID=2799335 RepID=UPI0018F49207|nr:TIGR02530 family flagellar biosynthesis protein [Paenibacillus alkalitolerans]
MTNTFTVGRLYPQPMPSKPVTPAGKPGASSGSGASSFHAILEEKRVSFSHHAEQRLQQRGIRLEPEQLAKLGGAIDKAASKGAKDSLVLFQDMAFIVNVKNRTVVTAMDDAAMKDHVFTQIDSTVVVR